MADPAQYMQALGRANDVRQARGAEAQKVRKMDYRSAVQAVADILAAEEFPYYLENCPVSDLLLWIPRFGHTRIRKLTQEVPVSEIKPLSALTARQRLFIASALEEIVGKDSAKS